jgi:hypothetical protein
MRMWEIRENSEYPRYGSRRSSMRGYKDEFEEGYECGYYDAMKELEHSYEGKESHRMRRY